MKKAFARYGLLGVGALSILCLALLLGLFRPARAQAAGGQPGSGTISGPIAISNAPGQHLQVNSCLFANGTTPRNARTTFDVLIDSSGPVSPVGGMGGTVRYTFTYPHMLDPTGRVHRLTLVTNGQNLDLYEDGVLVHPAVLNALPAGTPVLGYVINSQTVVEGPGNPVLQGVTEVLQPDPSSPTGVTASWGKSHELTGNVTLYK